jgi:ketosteroid isomerase-like protein
MSVWRKEAGGAWKVLLDIGTRCREPLESKPALKFPRINQKKAKKNMNLEQERVALKTADDNLSRLLSEEKPSDDLGAFIGNYLRVHRMNDFPWSDRNAALAALQTYQGKINSQTISAGIALSGDFAYSYGTYKAKEAKVTNGAKKNKPGENGSFARIWRPDEKGKWKLTLIVIHAAPPAKGSEQ